MKKLVFCLLTILTCGAMHALPLGNPADATLLCDGLFLDGTCCYEFCDPNWSWCDAFSVRFGYYGDFVYNRHLEVDDSFSGRNIEHTEIYTNAGYIAANIYDRFDIFATFGATNLSIDTNALVFAGGALNGQRLEIESTTDFSWSVGARATIFQWGCTYYGIETQYFQAHPDIRRVTLAAENSVYPDDTLDMKYWEWQIGIGVAHRINMLVPYVGAKYSRAQLNFDNAIAEIQIGTGPSTNIPLRRLETRFSGGFVVGVSFVDCEKMSLTVEGRWPDEKALYVNGQIRF